MISSITSQIRKLFSLNSTDKRTCKRPLEEESEDEERERRGGEKVEEEETGGERGEPMKKKKRHLATYQLSTYTHGVSEIMSGLYDWMYTLVSPRKREPPQNIGAEAYGSRARIKIQNNRRRKEERERGINMEERETPIEREKEREIRNKEDDDDDVIILTPEEYVRGAENYKDEVQFITSINKKKEEGGGGKKGHNTSTKSLHSSNLSTIPTSLHSSISPSLQPTNLSSIPTSLQPTNLSSIPTSLSPLPTSLQPTNLSSIPTSLQPTNLSSIPTSLHSSISSLQPTNLSSISPSLHSISPAFHFSPSEGEREQFTHTHAKWYKRSVHRRYDVLGRRQVTSNPIKKKLTKYIPTGNSLLYGRGSSCVQESFRFEDKMRYSQLLQQYSEGCNVRPYTRTPTHSCSSSSIVSVSHLTAGGTRRRKEELERKTERTERKMQRDLKTEEKMEKELEVEEKLERKTERRRETQVFPHITRRSELRAEGKCPTVIDLEETESSEDIALVCEVTKTPGYSKTIHTPPWLTDINTRYDQKRQAYNEEASQTQKLCENLEVRRKREISLQNHVTNSLRFLQLTHPSKVIEVGDEDDELEVEAKLVPLTPEIEDIIDGSLSQRGNTILVERFNIRITTHDLRTLTGLNWLNDEVINFYFNLIMERGNTEDNKGGVCKKSVYVFNTFFYPRLVKAGYTAVKRWTKKVDVYTYKLLLIPVHLGMHWCLCAVDFKRQCITYFDSMLADNDKCLQTIMSYLESEHLDKKKSSFDTTGWTLKHSKDIPQQMNGSDCGMFTCQFAEYLSREAKFNFSQEDMPYFRRRMMYEILMCTLL